MTRQIVARAIAGLAFACVGAAGASADSPGGIYVQGFAGIASSVDLDFTNTFTVPAFRPGSSDFKSIRPAYTGFDSGHMLGGGVGYTFANGLRVEFEFAHRKHDVKDVVFTDTGFAAGDVAGDLRVNSGMVNALYDFRSGTALTPYLGAGIGIAWTDMNVIRPPRVLDVNDTAFAYQLIAGLSLKVSPNIDIFGQYQYFSVPSLELGGDMVGNPGADSTVNMAFDDQYSTHSAVVGLRYRFSGLR